MPSIEEFKGAEHYPEAVEAAFEADVVVVRGMIEDPDPLQIGFISKSHHLRNPWRVRRISRMLPPEVEVSRQVVRSWLNDHAHTFDVGLCGRYTQRPDLRREGGIEAHIDDYPVVSATSLNLRNGSREPTLFYAERIASATAPYEDILDIQQARKDAKLDPVLEVELDVGDAVIISRGVLHKVEAPIGRQALMLTTRRRPIIPFHEDTDFI